MAEIFVFHKHGQGESFAVVWTNDLSFWGQSLALDTFLPGPVDRVVGHYGEDISVQDGQIELSGSPQYVFFTIE